MKGLSREEFTENPFGVSIELSLKAAWRIRCQGSGRPIISSDC